MQIPYSKDIRRVPEIGKGAKIIVSLEGVLDDLPLPSQMKEELGALSRQLAEVSLFVLNQKPGDGHLFTGRGRYSYHNLNGNRILVYTKGIGAAESISNSGKPLDPFTRDDGSCFFDLIDSRGYPRILGANYLDDSGMEFLNSLKIMVNIVMHHNLKSLDDLIKNGAPFPVSVGSFPGLFEAITPFAIKSLSDSKREWGSSRTLGSVTTVVPSAYRMGNTVTSLHSPYTAAVAAVQELFLSAGAVLSTSSQHLGNVYFADSICPFADGQDIIFPDHRLASYVLSRVVGKFGTQIMRSNASDKGVTSFINGFIHDIEKAERAVKVWYLFPWYAGGLVADSLVGRDNGPHYQIPESVIAKVMPVKRYNQLLKNGIERCNSDSKIDPMYSPSENEVEAAIQLLEAADGMINLNLLGQTVELATPFCEGFMHYTQKLVDESVGELNAKIDTIKELLEELGQAGLTNHPLLPMIFSASLGPFDTYFGKAEFLNDLIDSKMPDNGDEGLRDLMDQALIAYSH